MLSKEYKKVKLEKAAQTVASELVVVDVGKKSFYFLQVMRQKLGIAILTAALCLNPIAVFGQTSKNRFTTRVIQGILVELGTEAALEILRGTYRAAPEQSRAAFSDGEWLVSVARDGDTFTYYGVNLNSRDSITLRNARVTSSSDRQIYVWQNGNYYYQIAWQPSDPDFVRLQVFQGSSRELLNRLLYRVEV